MTNTLAALPADLDPIKTRHRAIWALGNYDKVATEVVHPLGEVVVETLGITPGELVLDIAAGSGNASLPAARRGARVVATDITPELLEPGWRRATAEGLEIEWRQADAEHLPYPDNCFDVTMSTIGAMFAPFHQPVADELLRVTRPGGRIGLANWTPQGFIGQLFATMKPYAPPPPPGAQPGPLWGEEDHVIGLLGDQVTDLVATRRRLRVDAVSSGTGFLEYFKKFYGPTIATYSQIAGDPAAVARLDQELAELAERFGAGGGTFDWEYLLVTATRR